MASSSKHSPLFSSEKGSMKGDPFLHGSEKPIFDRTAGKNDTRGGLDINCGNLMENLDDLTEEQLDELLQDALDINKRLKALERKQVVESRAEYLSDKMTFGKSSLPKQSPFLPPLEQTQTSLVTPIAVLQGAKVDKEGRRQKASVM